MCHPPIIERGWKVYHKSSSCISFSNFRDICCLRDDQLCWIIFKNDQPKGSLVGFFSYFIHLWVGEPLQVAYVLLLPESHGSCSGKHQTWPSRLMVSKGQWLPYTLQHRLNVIGKNMLWSQNFMVPAKRWLDFLDEQSSWLPRKIKQRFKHVLKGAELGPAYEEILFISLCV